MRRFYMVTVMFLCLMFFFVNSSCANGIVVNPIVTPQVSWPGTGSIFQVGENIQFLGQSSYVQNDELSWISSIDGVIGDGPSFDKNNLSVGIHTIFLRETYSWGGQDWRGQATVTITITDLPEVMPMLTSPMEGNIYKAGVSILFDCGVEDPRGMDINWYSDQVEGRIGEKTFTKSDLPVGDNKITMETPYGSVSVNIIVQGYKTSSIYEGSERAVYNMSENILFVPLYLDSVSEPSWIEMEMISQGNFVATGFGKAVYNSLTTYANFNFLSGVLTVPIIGIVNSYGGVAYYWANFSITSIDDPIQFQLIDYGVASILPISQ